MASLEALVLEGANRGAEKLRSSATFGLPALVSSLVGAQPQPRIGLLTGFPIQVETGTCTFENDGPIGAGHVALAASVLGWPQVIVLNGAWIGIVDAIASVAATLGLPFDPRVVTLEPHIPISEARKRLERFGLTHLLSIEHPGVAGDGFHYSMRGERIDARLVSADALFVDVPWTTAGFADGGNEIGMGNVDAEQIASVIQNGQVIASHTRTDHLTLCGVSNWGAYGLVVLLAYALPERRDDLLRIFKPETDQMLFAALKQRGAVDGVTRVPSRSVDGLDLAVHHEKISQLRQLVADFTQS